MSSPLVNDRESTKGRVVDRSKIPVSEIFEHKDKHTQTPSNPPRRRNHSFVEGVVEKKKKKFDETYYLRSNLCNCIFRVR